MIMNKYFIFYAEYQELINLGFNEFCIDGYETPLYSQAFKFLRDVYKLNKHIIYYEVVGKWGYSVYNLDGHLVLYTGKETNYLSYEICESECLRGMINFLNKK